MNRFADYMDFRHLLPLYEEAAVAISLDVPHAIRYCESRYVNRDKNKGEIYRVLALELSKLSETDYGSSAAAVKSAIELKKKADAAWEKTQATAAANAAKQKAASEEAERLKVAGGRNYQHAPTELVHMLNHVGSELKKLFSTGNLSQDYAAVLQTIVMDLNSSIRRGNQAPGEEELNKAKARHAAASKDMAAKASAGKSYNDLLEIVKTLRDNGLPTTVNDADAASAYDKVFKLLFTLHKSGGNLRRAIDHWIKHEEIGNDRATEGELAVLQALSKLKTLPQPGNHTHEPIPEEPEPKDDEKSLDLPPEDDASSPEDDASSPEEEDDDEDWGNGTLPPLPPRRKSKQVRSYEHVNNLQEQEQHSIMLQVLAGLRRE